MKFDLQLFAVKDLPESPTTSTATVGKDYLLFIATGMDIANPTWVLIGGQRGLSLSRQADEIDVSSKTSGGWKDTLAGLKSWSIDLDGLLLLNDDGVDTLEYAFIAGSKVFLKMQYPNKRYRTGWCSITDFSNEAPHDGEASLKGTLSGSGPLSDLQGYGTSPTTASVSKATPVDKTFAFTPNTGVVTGITLAGAAVTGTNFTASAGNLLIKGTYLGTLAIADQLFTLTFSDGSSETLTITITA